MSTFDASQLKAWLHTCETEHTACRESTSESDTPTLKLRFDESATSNFRVVDLQRGCIVPASLDSRYVTLSCVVSEDDVRLTTANYEELTTDGVLANIRPSLSPTVRNALDLVKAIGERYLWVDSLCLVHDDEQDLDVGVSIQHSVFSGALITIVAARDGTSGLYQCIINNDGIDAVQALSMSAYSTHAPTLGELALSQRAVLLTDNGVFFCCRNSTSVWSDATLNSIPGPSLINRVPGTAEGILSCIASYMQLTQEYSQRTLARDGDALHSFYGMGRSLFAGMRTDAVEGLPGYFINAFLLFKISKGHRRSEFASFSWAGWSGGIEWLLAGDGDTTEDTATDIVSWLQNNSLVEWDELSKAGSMRRLRQWRLPGFDGTPVAASNLAAFIKENAHLFGDTITSRIPNQIDNDIISPEDSLPYAVGSSARLDMVDWKKDILKKDGLEASQRFPRWAFDLVNSRGQLGRQLRRLGPGGVSEKAARSWAASRWARTQKLKAQRRSPTKPVPGGHTPRYSPPRLADDNEQEQERLFADPRAKNARQEARANPGGEAVDIPAFPPYSVLVGWAVHLSLAAGTPYSEGEEPPTRLDLLSSSSTVVGRFFPDDTTLPPPQGSTVNLILLGWVTSAQSASNDSLWVMAIEWEAGIAYRRGIGRVRTAALDLGAALNGPSIKRILLG